MHRRGRGSSGYNDPYGDGYSPRSSMFNDLDRAFVTMVGGLFFFVWCYLLITEILREEDPEENGFSYE